MPKSSAPFAATLDVDARPSWGSTACIAGAYAAAASGVLWLALPWGIAGLALSLLAGWCDIKRIRQRVRLVWRSDGYWTVGQSGEAISLRLCAPTFVSRWVVVIVLRDQRGRLWRYCLTRLGVAGPAWRRLRARLCVEGPAMAAATGGWRTAGEGEVSD